MVIPSAERKIFQSIRNIKHINQRIFIPTSFVRCQLPNYFISGLLNKKWFDEVGMLKYIMITVHDVFKQFSYNLISLTSRDMLVKILESIVIFIAMKKIRRET